jgi:hypothetical protein
MRRGDKGPWPMSSGGHRDAVGRDRRRRWWWLGGFLQGCRCENMGMAHMLACSPDDRILRRYTTIRKSFSHDAQGE